MEEEDGPDNEAVASGISENEQILQVSENSQVRLCLNITFSLNTTSRYFATLFLFFSITTIIIIIGRRRFSASIN